MKNWDVAITVSVAGTVVIEAEDKAAARAIADGIDAHAVTVSLTGQHEMVDDFAPDVTIDGVSPTEDDGEMDTDTGGPIPPIRATGGPTT